jgi:LysM repeat protein
MNSVSSSKTWRLPVICLTLLLVLAFLASVLPTGVAAAAAKKKCDKTYEVRRGDTLKKIGERFGWAPNQIVYVNGMNVPYTIYVGQKMCLPEEVNNKAPKVSNSYAALPAAYFTAGRTANDVLVYTYNYPKTSVIVKVDNAGDSVKKFVNVGAFSVGNQKTWRFKLPTELKKASKLTICLKDTTTNYLQCVVPRSGS